MQRLYERERERDARVGSFIRRMLQLLLVTGTQDAYADNKVSPLI